MTLKGGHKMKLITNYASGDNIFLAISVADLIFKQGLKNGKFNGNKLYLNLMNRALISRRVNSGSRSLR